MKLMKRAGIYQGSNYKVTFDPKTIKAVSYNWWNFVQVIEGKTIFNSFRYSVSTSKHQRKVKSLMSQLGIKIDVFVSVSQSLGEFHSLAALYLEAEEQACDKILSNEIKKQDRNEKARERREQNKAMQRMTESSNAKQSPTLVALITAISTLGGAQ